MNPCIGRSSCSAAGQYPTCCSIQEISTLIVGRSRTLYAVSSPAQIPVGSRVWLGTLKVFVGGWF
eukprot:3540092-Amphidinium_carterae.1